MKMVRPDNIIEISYASKIISFSIKMGIETIFNTGIYIGINTVQKSY